MAAFVFLQGPAFLKSSESTSCTSSTICSLNATSWPASISQKSSRTFCTSQASFLGKSLSWTAVNSRISKAHPVGLRAQAAETETKVDYEALDKELATKSPREVIAEALKRFGSDVAISFSGAEDVILIEYAAQTKLPFRVFSLDTGRLHPETYRFFDKVEKHYGIKIEYTFPESAAVEKLVREKGMFSFYEDGHNECCGVRKVQPLRKHLGGLKAWITGQRKDQSPGTRAAIPIVQVDPAFKGIDGGELIKFNPLAETSSYDVWFAIRTLEVPYNELHERGIISIGCEPCTKPVLPSMHEREGRWWWEEATQKECGLHKGNIEK